MVTAVNMTHQNDGTDIDAASSYSSLIPGGLCWAREKLTQTSDSHPELLPLRQETCADGSLCVANILLAVWNRPRYRPLCSSFFQ